jgi:hypothetical protein
MEMEFNKKISSNNKLENLNTNKSLKLIKSSDINIIKNTYPLNNKDKDKDKEKNIDKEKENSNFEPENIYENPTNIVKDLFYK